MDARSQLGELARQPEGAGSLSGMARPTSALRAEEISFLTERHLATLTTLRPAGRPHVVAIAFTFEDGLVRIITNAASRKVRNVEHTGWAAVCQVDGERWLTLEGPATVTADPARVGRPSPPTSSATAPSAENPYRVAIEIAVEQSSAGSGDSAARAGAAIEFGSA